VSADRVGGPTAANRAAREVETLARLAWWLDDAVRIPWIGVRFGLDPLLGLVPGLGDAAGAIVSLLIVGAALRHRVPKTVVVRMALNVAFDYAIGLLPVAGDVADVFVKSNDWNLALLRRHAGTGRPPSRGDRLLVWGVLVALVLLLAAGLVLAVLLLRAVAHALAGWWR
jgi:uncharacterized protein DUF4112